ncbi:hypothetical protein ACJU26_01820 [Acidithiobacillus sp. M4-SHS-6]|uniref:hypothetical protein n=1 Tax=Acidithiobacillus sp. M4-SHS-6 TaxID=3383024 RepID=UPI0039BEAA4C
MRRPMKTRLHLPLLLLFLGLSSTAWAKDVPTPAPKVSTPVESKGVGDPYPAADALARKNLSVYTDAVVGGTLDFNRTRAWDGSGTMLDVNGAAPSFAWVGKHFNESMRNCSALDSGITPQGMSWTSDLHDFAFSPKLMQAKLAAQGFLFAPLGTTRWKALRASYYLYFHGRKSQMQGFMRMLYFVSTASPSQIRQMVLQLSADRGYQASDTELRKLPGYVGGDTLTILKQQVTPHVFNQLMVSADEADNDDKEEAAPTPSEHWSMRCLVTDDFGKDWLNKVNPKTGKRWQPADLILGSMVEFSYLPLGEKTEPYTNAHVDERLARERKITPQQVAALRKAEADQVQKEIWRDAPQAQKALADIAALQDKAADMAEQLRRQGFVEQWASMTKDLFHRLGVNFDDRIDATAQRIDAKLQQAVHLARRAAQQIRRFLSALWS